MSDLERRMFFMDGERQMVAELDGSVHEADPNDPDLLAAIEQQRAWLADIADDDANVQEQVIALENLE